MQYRYAIIFTGCVLGIGVEKGIYPRDLIEPSKYDQFYASHTFIETDIALSSIGGHLDSVQKSQKSDSIAAIESQYEKIVFSMLGNSITHGIDASVSPCEDHFRFVNDGWRNSVILPATKDRRFQMTTFFTYAHHRMLHDVKNMLQSARKSFKTTENATLQVLGTFYESCMTADSLETNYMKLRSRKTVSRDSTRDQQCLSRVMKHLGAATGQGYAQNLKASGAVGKMELLLKELKLAVEERLKSNRLMTEDERILSLERLNRLILRVGIPDQEVDYSSLHLFPDNYERNKTQIIEFNNSAWVNSIGSNIREKWKLSLLTANAVYMPGDHAIEIPSLMFSPPFFFHDGEDLLNFAGIGYIIGHEIFHSVAQRLSSISGQGMKAEIDSFKAFNTSLGEFEGWRTDGERTFSEDVADLGGSRVAYRAWKESVRKNPSYKAEVVDGFTPDQRFYIAMGRVWRSKWTKSGVHNGVHGPNFARVNGVAMQNPEFREIFGCKPGDKMYLSDDKLSKIW